MSTADHIYTNYTVTRGDLKFKPTQAAFSRQSKWLTSDLIPKTSDFDKLPEIYLKNWKFWKTYFFIEISPKFELFGFFLGIKSEINERVL